MKLFGSKSGRSEKPENSSLPWIPLNDSNMIDHVRSISFDLPVLIYKHSTRCGISSMMLGRLERDYEPEEAHMQWYILDLIRFREVSEAVADQFGVLHESPQVLLIIKGKVVYHNSHGGISFKALKPYL